LEKGGEGGFKIREIPLNPPEGVKKLGDGSPDGRIFPKM